MDAAAVRQEARRIAPPGRGTRFVKRGFDIICAALGLVVLSPLLGLCALLAAASSPGGAMFRQERAGRGEKPFYICKFRTMRKDNAGLKITTGDDPRITGVGKILRKSKLDELPQLWNVLKGDMSFVGPRPEVPEYTRLYTEEQKQVFLVRPGITDLASIEFRNENELLAESADPERVYVEEILPRKLSLGLDYIERMSLLYDLKLIFRTIAVVIRD